MMVPKFRVWHMPFGPKGQMQEMVHGKASSILEFAEMSPDEYIVEQFTGLKDVNGKDIYVGDIVKYHNLDDKYQYLPIIWLNQDCLVSAGGYRIDIVARRCEVIGNIHENSELLEAQHETRTD